MIPASATSPAELRLDESIGGWGIDPNAVAPFLAGLTERDVLSVYILSGGGSVLLGNAIFNDLLRCKARKVAHVDFAASMASVLAMACDEIEMAANGWLMIHNPWTETLGEADDLRRQADVMDAMKEHIMDAYQRHATTVSREDLSRMMDEETWLDAERALALGFIDRIAPAVAVAAACTPAGNAPDEAKAWFKAAGVEAAPEPPAAVPAPEPEPQPEPAPVRSAEADEAWQEGYDAGHAASVESAVAAARAEWASGVAASVAAAQEEAAGFAASADVERARADDLERRLAALQAEHAALTARANAAVERMQGLLAGARFQPKAAEPDTFEAAVAAHQAAGMTYDAALIKVRGERPQLFSEYLKRKNPNHANKE
jgi:ATP-dependent protease ClpP protease subunit